MSDTTGRHHLASTGAASGVGRRTDLRRHLGRALGAEHNALCRPADRARSTLVLATAVLLTAAVVGAWFTALLVLHAGQSSAAQQRAHRHLVTAVTAGQPVANIAYGNAEVQARWTYPARTAHTAWIQVSDQTQSGAQVSTWVDDAGQPSSAPRSTASVAADAALTGAGALLGETGLLALAFDLTTRLIDRRAARAWGEEWTHIEPGWSGRSRRHPGDWTA